MRKPLDGPYVWTGDELAGADDWRFRLTPPMLAEIDAALVDAKRSGIAWEAMQRADFPLPNTAVLLADISRTLEEGRGLAKLTGLPVERYDEEDRRRCWYGIGLPLGPPVSLRSPGRPVSLASPRPSSSVRE